MSFFKKYGFLFSLKEFNQYISVDINDIIYIKENLEALINLLNTQESSEIDYKKNTRFCALSHIILNLLNFYQ